MMQTDTKLGRRRFIAGTATAAALTVVPRYVLAAAGAQAPSDKLNIAGVGVGGKGFGDVRSVPSENIVALCDVDKGHAARAFKQFPKAKVYTDFRKMLDEQKNIDAITVATPDHNHAVVAIRAMKMGKHVYCQKPLTHSIHEAWLMGETAKRMKVATQMGNQGQASETSRIVRELILDGAIGNVTEVHSWSNRSHRISPRGIARPKDTPATPATLDWDLWLGPAPHRPYHPAYLPFRWRGWWDFGTGVLGDIGCHQLSTVFKALDLGYPTSVESGSTNTQEPPEVANETAPLASTVRFKFPAKGKRPAVRIIWYDGGMMPPRPDELEEGRAFGVNDGSLIVGDKGKILGHRLIPETRMQEYGKPPKVLTRSPGHYKEWLIACKGGKPAGSNFVDHASLLTQVILMGNVSIRTRRKLLWDGEKRRFTNCDEANKYINPPYREGWTL